MRDVLTVIIVVLILGILLDGWRRMRNARRDTLKVSRAVYRPKPSDKHQAPEERVRSPFSSELPNGGARVVGSRTSATSVVRKENPGAPKTVKSGTSTSPTNKSRQNFENKPDPLDPDWADSDNEPPVQATPIWSETPKTGIADIESADADTDSADYYDNEYLNTAGPDAEPVQVPVRRAKPEEESARIPQQVTLNLDESVPLLMESVEDDEQESETTQSYSAASRTREGESLKASAHQSSMAGDYGTQNIGNLTSDDERIEPTLGAGASLDSFDIESFDIESSDIESSDIEGSDIVSPGGDHGASQAEPPKSKGKANKAAPKFEPASSAEEEDPGEPEEVLIINVMARPGHYFQGEPLLQEIFDAGMRYGSMNIFHRYRDARGGGPVLFSLANMVKPGTFDLDAMEQFQTPGVSLFMTLPMSGDSLEAFDLMLDTAKGIAENLYGELKDENRSVMTKQTMEHARQRVLEFERRQLSRAHH